MTDAGFYYMPREKNLSRLEQQQAMNLWTRGCLVVMVVGMLGLAIVSTRLFELHQNPYLNVTPERINPNTASIASLVRLDGIGRARAMDIIHFRQTHRQDGPVFQTAHDLEHIRGIGPKTAEKMLPWLVFDDDLHPE